MSAIETDLENHLNSAKKFEFNRPRDNIFQHDVNIEIHPGHQRFGFSELINSLNIQAEALGLSQIEKSDSKNSITFTNQTSRTDALEWTLSCDIGSESYTAHCSTSSTIENVSNSYNLFNEFTLQASTGLMSVHGRTMGEPTGLNIPFISCFTSVLSMQSGMASLFSQLNGDTNYKHCRISFESAALVAISQYIAGASAEEQAESILPDTYSTTDAGSPGNTFFHPPFRSKDGVIFELETLSVEPWLNFWLALGVAKPVIGQGWKNFMLRYAKAVAPLPSELQSVLSRLSYSDINMLAERAALSICPVRQTDAVADDRNITPSAQHPWRFSTRENISAEEYDVDTLKNIRLATPKSPNAIPKGPLSGVTVIESCRRIQGPMASHLLAQLGATVIRIEPPGGDPLRGMLPVSNGVSVRYDALNRHKAILEIDIKSTHGRLEVLKLVQNADVFIQNWAPSKAASLGLDECNMHKVNDKLIYVYAGGWGKQDAHVDLPGTDFMVQAYSGIADLIQKQSSRSGGSLFTMLDLLGGAICAQGVVSALLKNRINQCNENDGATVPAPITRVDTSLLDSANLLIDVDNVRNQQSPSINETLLKGCYATLKAQDGFIAIDCRSYNFNLTLQFYKAIGVGPEFKSTLDEITNSASYIDQNRQSIHLNQFNDITQQPHSLNSCPFKSSYLQSQFQLQQQVNSLIRQETCGHWLDRFHNLGIAASFVPLGLYKPPGNETHTTHSIRTLNLTNKIQYKDGYAQVMPAWDFHS